jgi:L-arabinose transport system ATP-binding protein
MGNGALLKIDDVSKTFGVVRALRGVTLEVRPGEVLALVGENGAGKSTLMRIVEGVFPPDLGSLEVDGRRVSFLSPADAHALGIRVIHQEPEIIPELSVAENLFLGDLPRRRGGLVDWTSLERRAQAVLQDFDMGHELPPRRICTRLGPAQRQMIEIMRAVSRGGRLIAFDEPTSSLTDEEAHRLFAIIRRLKAQGTAVVYISHRLPEVIALADHVAVLRDGGLVAQRPVPGVSEADIAQLMVGRDLGSLYSRTPGVPGRVLLEVRGLATHAVRDVTLTVRAGEVVGLGGLMGAGRSELARGIFGFDRRLAGEVLLEGRALKPNSPGDAILAGIGFAPEDRKQEALLLARSVLDNMTLCVPEKVSRFGLFDRSRALRLGAPIAERLRIRTPSLDHPVAKLSGGNQQKAVLGRWIARAPKVLILDEPTRGIDVGAKAEIYRLVDALAAAGMGILLISSEMPELIGLADRILVMSGGRIAGALDRPTSEEAILDLAMSDTKKSREIAA